MNFVERQRARLSYVQGRTDRIKAIPAAILATASGASPVASHYYDAGYGGRTFREADASWEMEHPGALADDLGGEDYDGELGAAALDGMELDEMVEDDADPLEVGSDGGTLEDELEYEEAEENFAALDDDEKIAFHAEHDAQFDGPGFDDDDDGDPGDDDDDDGDDE